MRGWGGEEMQEEDQQRPWTKRLSHPDSLFFFFRFFFFLFLPKAPQYIVVYIFSCGSF